MEMVSKKITHPPPDLPLEGGGTAVQIPNRTILSWIMVSTNSKVKRYKTSETISIT